MSQHNGRLQMAYCGGEILGSEKGGLRCKKRSGRGRGLTEQRGRSLTLANGLITDNRTLWFSCESLPMDPRQADGQTHRHTTRLDSVTQLDVYLHVDVSGCNNMFTTILDGGDVAFWLHSAGFFLCVFFFFF